MSEQLNPAPVHVYWDDDFGPVKWHSWAVIVVRLCYTFGCTDRLHYHLQIGPVGNRTQKLEIYVWVCVIQEFPFVPVWWEQWTRMTNCCICGCWIAAALALRRIHTILDDGMCVCACLCMLLSPFHFSYVVLSSSLSCTDWSSAQRLFSVQWWVRACALLLLFLYHLCC